MPHLPLRIVLAVTVAATLPLPVLAQSEAAAYDQPARTERAAVFLPGVGSGGGLICYYYDRFMVKRIDSGTPRGDLSIAVVPASPAAPPDCVPARGAAEVRIRSEGQSFVGVKGDFLVTQATAPGGAVAFTVHDRRSAAPRYSDWMSGLDLRFIADDAGMLHLRYRRGVNGSCSIPKDGQACWARIAREARFPRPVAQLAAPVAACTAAYAARHAAPDAPSVVEYDVDLVVPARGGPQVLSRGDPSCEPRA